MELSKLSGKKIFLTGHTGFKGAWLLQMLHHLGAEVVGYALEAEPENALYHQINGDQYCVKSYINDINDLPVLQKAILDFEPDFIFHLAAQALVKKGYADPVGTYATNVMGTVHVLEAMRHLRKKCVAVMVTTDKVYENPETGALFSEVDKLGGYDPYSSSKACDEILIDSFRRSYFNPADYTTHQKSIASVRAGNVIGGGDYASDRIIPDIVRAIASDQAVLLRNPNAVRPWQLVLEPLYAYLLLAVKMEENPIDYNQAYNIGPEKSDILNVLTVTEKFIKAFGKGSYQIAENELHPHEAHLLLLDNTKIKNDIGFRPTLHADQAIGWTADWYANDQVSAAERCQNQILQYLDILNQYNN